MQAYNPFEGRIYIDYKLDGDKSFKSLRLHPTFADDTRLSPPTDEELDRLFSEITLFKNWTAQADFQNKTSHVRRQVSRMMEQIEDDLVERLTRAHELDARIQEFLYGERSDSGTEPPSSIPPQS